MQCPSSAAALLSLSILAVALPACVIHVGGPDGLSFGGWSGGTTSTVVDGRDVTERDGVLSVEGRELHHARWVDVALPAGSCETLQLSTATGPVNVGGQPGDGTLRVRLWSEVHGDGTVTVQHGRLVARGSHGEVLVNEVAGSVPHGMSLRADSGTGAIILHALQSADHLEVESGTGEVRLTGCTSTRIFVEAGTSDVQVRGGQAERVDLNSGTGEVCLSGGRFGDVRVGTGTGDVSVEDCTVQKLQASSGTGDLVVHGGRVEEFHHELGTGEIHLRGGVRVGLDG